MAFELLPKYLVGNLQAQSPRRGPEPTADLGCEPIQARSASGMQTDGEGAAWCLAIAQAAQVQWQQLIPWPTCNTCRMGIDWIHAWT